MARELDELSGMRECTLQYDIYIEGVNYNKLKPYISNMEIIDRQVGARELRLTMNNHNEFILNEHKDKFREGNVIELDVGWNTTEPLIAGEIVEIEPTREDMNTVMIVAMDRTHRMMDSDNTTDPLTNTRNPTIEIDEQILREPPPIQPRVFKGKRDDQIVMEILSHFGFEVNTDTVDRSDIRMERVLNCGVSAFNFIQKLAVQNDCFFWVEYVREQPQVSRETIPDIDENPEQASHIGKWVAYFKRAESVLSSTDNYGTVYRYFTDNVNNPLLAFNSSRISRNMPSEIEVIGYNTRMQKVVRYRRGTGRRGGSSNAPDVSVVGSDTIAGGMPIRGEPRGIIMEVINGREVFGSIEHKDTQNIALLMVSAFGRRVEIPVADRVFRNPEDADRFASQYIRARMHEFMQGQITVIGNPKLRARQRHYIVGLSPEENGYWDVFEARHKIGDNGYGVIMEIRKAINPDTLNQIESPVYGEPVEYEHQSMLISEFY